jgi:Short C-terminal domain
MMRRRGPGLIGVAATTAVVAGTAGAVRNRQAQKYGAQQQASAESAEQQQMAAQMAAQQAQLDAMQAQQAAPAAPPAAAPQAGLSMDQKMVQLQQLGELKNAGILTDEEFAAQKAAILAS